MKLSECGWVCLVMNDLDLVQIQMHPMLIQNVAQVLDPIHAKGAFFKICIHLVLPQSVQNLLNMLQVFLPTLFEEKDVIQIHHHKRIGERSQYIIHQSHESYWSICQTKRHDQPFEKTFFGLESSLPYISIFYWDLVVARLQVSLVEKFGSLELVKKVINSWKQVPVPNCNFVQGPVINVELPSPIFILHKYNWAPTK